MLAKSEILALECKFFDAFERGNSVAIADCYMPETRVWNNVMQREATGFEHIADLEVRFFPVYSNRKFVDVRTNFFDGGFVRQHLFTGSCDGAAVRIPMCIVCQVGDGKIKRIDEYLTFALSPKL